MNKTFKIVFNKTRGALMVANEATCSVQKKGARLVVAVAALTSCGVSFAGIANDTVHFATDTTISTNAPSGEDNCYSGIAATEKGKTTSVTVADGATLSINGSQKEFPTAARLYLINAVEGSSVTTNGNLIGNLSANTNSVFLRGVRAYARRLAENLGL